MLTCDDLTVLCERITNASRDGKLTHMRRDGEMCTVPRVVGAQDFLPDFEPASSCVSITSIYPRYQPISSATQKAKKWIADARVRAFVA